MKFALPFLLLALCYVLLFGYVATTYNSLPPRIASHFDLQGRANGWMSRDAAVIFTIGVGSLLPVLIVGTTLMVRWLPARAVNIPNRDYWLAPERRAETSAVLLRFGIWLACLTELFIIAVHRLVVQANAAGGARNLDSGNLLLVAGGFLAGTLIWGVCLAGRFGRKD